MTYSLRYWILFSTAVHLPEWYIAPSLKGYLSFMLDRSCLQRVRTHVSLQIALSMPVSLESNLSCLTSLPSNSKLLILFSQHRNSRVIMCSPGWQLKSFHISWCSLRDKDQVVNSWYCSVSSSHSCDGPALSFFAKQDVFCVHFFLCTGLRLQILLNKSH